MILRRLLFVQFSRIKTFLKFGSLQRGSRIILLLKVALRSMSNISDLSQSTVTVMDGQNQNRVSLPTECYVSENSVHGCKNHPYILGMYYCCENPWTKYCQNCALNIALSGKKIEKELTSEETCKKIAVTETISLLQETLKSIGEEGQTAFSAITQSLEQSRVCFSGLIQSLSVQINELSALKSRLEEVLRSQITQQIDLYFGRRNQTVTKKVELSSAISRLESEFAEVIGQKTEFVDQVTKATKVTCQEAKKLAVSKGDFRDVEIRIKNVSETFDCEIGVLVQKGFSGLLKGCSTSLQGVVDKSRQFFEDCNRETACSSQSGSALSSALVTDRRPLGELKSGNRRSERLNACLQLRCKSKGKQSARKTIDVNSVVAEEKKEGTFSKCSKPKKFY